MAWQVGTARPGVSAVHGRFCTGADCNESTEYKVRATTTVAAIKNQASWIHTVLQHFDSEVQARPDGCDESGSHDPVVDRQSTHSLSGGKVNSPMLCLVLPHKDGSHGWYLYHLMGLPDERSAEAFREFSGNLALLAHGASVESDETVPHQLNLVPHLGKLSTTLVVGL